MRTLCYSVALAIALGGAGCVVKTAGTANTGQAEPPPPPPDNERVAAARPAPEPAQPQPGAERPNETVPSSRPGTPPQPAQPQPGAERPNETVPSSRPGQRTPFSIEPTAGPVGTTVTIYGDFSMAKRPADLGVSFNGVRQLIKPRTVAATAITAVVPKKAQSGPVRVTLRRRVLWTGEFSVTEIDEGILVPTEGGKGLIGSVYRLPPKTRKLPNFATLGNPFATIAVPNLNVKPRNFKAGFPGLGGKDKLLEWFAIRFEGELVVPAAGAYQFRTNSDDGTKVYIDGSLVLDNDGVHAPRARDSKPVQLTAGSHAIVIEYFQGPRYQIAAQLFWRQGGGAWDVIKPRFFRR